MLTFILQFVAEQQAQTKLNVHSQLLCTNQFPPQPDSPPLHIHTKLEFHDNKYYTTVASREGKGK